MFEVAIIWLLIGLIAGSFTNVLILREGVGALWGRSACPSCNTTLKPRDLVPVLSWIFLRARCRTCHAPISVQYPLVELAVGIGFYVVGGLLLPLHLKIIACAIIVVLVAIAFYDLYHMLMPNAWVMAWNALALSFTFVWLAAVGAPLEQYLLAIGWGVAVAAPLFVLHFFSGGTWMGFGDVKFASGMGFLLGPYGFVALFYAFVSGAIVGLFLVFLSSSRGNYVRALVTPTQSADMHHAKVTMKSEVPFGPFLIASTLFIWFALFHAITPIFGIFGALA